LVIIGGETLLEVLVQLVAQVLELLVPEQISIFEDVIPLGDRYGYRIVPFLPEDPLQVVRSVNFVGRAKVPTEEM